MSSPALLLRLSASPARLAVVLLVSCIVGACAPAPLRTSLPSDWTPSPSYGERRPNFVIIHHTTNDTAERALGTLTNPERELSAHYLIARDGRLMQLVDERLRAWHAGESYWGGNTDLNSSSIGIELDNNGNEPFAEAQITTLLALLADLRERYRIPAANVLGHGDIAPRRKADPSHWFPWKRLAAQGFGLWCDLPDGAALSTAPGVPERSSALLQAIGYDVSNPAAAITAFRRHYRGDPDNRAASTDLDDAERAQALCLAERRRMPAD